MTISWDQGKIEWLCLLLSSVLAVIILRLLCQRQFSALTV